MSSEKRFGCPESPFPVGVEYYRAPTPKPECWDEDFARLRAAGFEVIRSFSYWNWMEPQPGLYELEDFDRLFELAEKHGLLVWLDIVLGTHGACPEWLTREYPDMRVVNYRGQRVESHAGPAYPQGGMIHCYDHPAWREYGGALLRHVVDRYKDRPNLLIWGLWDGINLASAWSPICEGYPCYCEHTIAGYKAWLRERFTLDALNARLSRRYRRWEDVHPPRSNQNVVEMLLYRQFHYENLADHLKWMVREVKEIDPDHEARAHGAWFPRPWDERCAPHVDSWGMSMSSNNLLTSNHPYRIADRSFAFDWSRQVGRDGRWWHEEIYAGMSPGGVTWKKQSDPRELTTLLWMSLAGGAAGAMFWQYRPEYLSFESPGYNLVALDGEPTPRFEAVARAIRQIKSLAAHLPLECPRPEVGIVYHPESQELFSYNGESDRFLADLRGVYRTLWTHGIPADIITPRMDWSGYQLLFLPNVALMDADTQKRIERTLDESPETRFVAEGNFGMYSADGQSSYRPPEGFADRFGVRVADFSSVTTDDIAAGQNGVETPYGAVTITSSCGYALLQPRDDTRAIASLDGNTVAVQTADGRFTWFGFTLSAGFGDVGQPDLVLGLTAEVGIQPPVAVEGDRVVPVARRSHRGGWLLFAFNLERREARVTLRPRWRTVRAHDLLNHCDVPIQNDALQLVIPPCEVAVIHCIEDS
ncbi:MAG: beta-galactosidase [Candidatus Poribacteria bacterium]|nr:beta-galactosidase [Candidatus Poribacteria bacterium]